jgi:L-ribulose-5-phosphate 4-epimerase
VSKYVKFACECLDGGSLATFDGFPELNAYRRKLLQLRLIGVDANGIGFGNLSIRSRATNNFYITGAATSGMPELKPADCVKMVSSDFEKNLIQYEGSAIPSSESLTHAAVYESDAGAGAVIHCHDLRLWRTLLDEGPATSTTAEYGTTEMAREVMHLFKSGNMKQKKILVMTGHEGGVIAFGGNIEEAFSVLISEWKKSAAGASRVKRDRLRS